MKKQIIDMKPEQLRKGNLLVNQLDGSLIVVKAYDIYCLEDGMDSCIMQPIILNEEWVLKIDVIIKEEYRIFWSNFGSDLQGYFLWISGFKKYFKYVHQLQNFYFDLTEEELTIKK